MREHCQICDEELPEDYWDSICEECRDLWFCRECGVELSENHDFDTYGNLCIDCANEQN